MQAFRIYHIENGKKIYLCNRPGYWLHVSSDPEYAIPFLVKEKASEKAIFADKYVAPTGVRYVEEYVENRKLARLDDHVVLAEMIPYFTSNNVSYELIA